MPDESEGFPPDECPIQVVLAGDFIDCTFPRGHAPPHSWAVPGAPVFAMAPPASDTRDRETGGTPLVMPADEFATVQKLQARLDELENAVSWNTSCLGCAAVLDSSIREHVRAERAEEKLAAETERAERAYANGWRDSALALAAELEKRAEGVAGGDRSLLVRVMAPTMAAIFREAAVDARRQATDSPEALDEPVPVSQDPASRTDSLSAPPETIPLFDTEGNPPS